MGNKKALKDLLANIRDRESCQRISSKPFRPCSLHVIVSTLAPQYYSEEELAQLKNFSDLDMRKETIKNDLIQKRSHQIEEVLEEEMDKEMNKKSRKMIVSNNATPPSSPPELPQLPIEFMNRIRELEGSDIKFLMHKKLFNSDICQNNNRLSMPQNAIMCDFLTEDENEKLTEREGSKGRLIGMEVTLLDPCLREFTLFLKEWEMKTVIYNLVTNWKHIVAENKLQRDHKLQIWSFRVDKKLYFLLNKCET